MWRPSPVVRALVCIVVLAMFGVRAGGVHLHLCFDGQEPPASIHLEHSTGHDDHHDTDAPHQDQDVELAAATFIKKAGFDNLDLPATVFVLAAVIQTTRQSTPSEDLELRSTGPPHFFSPPLRGPPA